METHQHSLKAKNVTLKLTISVILLLLSLSAHPQTPPKTIAITMIVAHPSLEQARKGILDVLQENGYTTGKNLKIIEDNAQGSIVNASLIAKKYKQLKPDAIVAISTSSAQSIVNATKGSKIPIVFSSVSDPTTAGLVDHASGAMDFPPIPEEISLIQKFVPHIKTLGVLYNPGESNSAKTIALLKATLPKDIKLIESSVPNSSQAGQALNSLTGKVDAVYIPSDNTVFSALPLIVKQARKHKILVFSSDPDSVKQGFLACVGYTQYAVGRAAGLELIRVLQGDLSLKIVKPEKTEIYINQTTANQLGVIIPSTLDALVVP